MQPDPLSLQEVKQPEPSLIQETKSPKRNSTVTVLAVFLAILCIAVIGVGFWAYKLNNSLVATQQQLATVQSDYAKLKSSNEKLGSDLKQYKADFEKTDKDLTTAQTDLKKAQNQNKGIQDKIDLVSQKMEILYTLSTVKNSAEIFAVDTLIKKTNDKKLLTQWNNFISLPSNESSVKFLFYLIDSIRDDLETISNSSTALSANTITV